MRAAVFHQANQPMTIETLEVAKPKAHEVLLNTAYAGLCHSDLHFLEGLYPIQVPCVLGHESSAVVESQSEVEVGGIATKSPTSNPATGSSPARRCSAAPAPTAPRAARNYATTPA